MATEKGTNNTKNKKNNFIRRLIPDVLREKRTSRIALSLVVGFTVMVICIITLVTGFVTYRFSETLKVQTAELTNQLTSQMGLNLNNFLDTIESNSQIVFSDITQYSYDPTLGLHNEYDAILLERQLSENLRMQSRMRKYLDYCIAYRNGTTLGIISDSTRKNYGNTLYEEVEKALNGRNSTWITGKNGEYALVYYAIRVNENGILVMSMYTQEVLTSIKAATAANDMMLYLTDPNYTVIYSSDKETKAGERLSNQVRNRIAKNGTRLDSAYMVSTAVASNGWYLVMVKPAQKVLEVVNSTVGYVIIIAIVLTIIFIIVTIRMCIWIMASMNKTVHTLDIKAQIDLLTGIYNKKSFEEVVNEELSNSSGEFVYALVFMDVDNFKGVNDNCGHDIGDEVLKFFARSIGKAFRESDIKGRLGGDEFCVLMRVNAEYANEIEIQAEAACGRFRDLLHAMKNSNRQTLPPVTSSMGIAIADSEDKTFDSLYKKADTALYESKKKGKDTWTLYGERMSDNENGED